MSLRRAGARIGVQASYLHYLEHSQRCPSVAVAHQLIAVLRLEPELAERLLAEARSDAGRSWHRLTGSQTAGEPIDG